MLDFNNHIAGFGVLEVERVVYVVDGGVGHAAAFEDGKPLLGRPLLGNCLNLVLELDAVGNSVSVGSVLAILLPLRPAETVAQNTE